MEVVVCGVTGTHSAGPPSCAATKTYPDRHLPFTGGTLPGTVGLPAWQSRPRQRLLVDVVVVVRVVVVPRLSEAPPEPPEPEPEPAPGPGVVAVGVAAGETAAALLEVVVLDEAVTAVVGV